MQLCLARLTVSFVRMSQLCETSWHVNSGSALLCTSVTVNELNANGIFNGRGGAGMSSKIRGKPKMRDIHVQLHDHRGTVTSTICAHSLSQLGPEGQNSKRDNPRQLRSKRIQIARPPVVSIVLVVSTPLRQSTVKRQRPSLWTHPLKIRCWGTKHDKFFETVFCKTVEKHSQLAQQYVSTELDMLGNFLQHIQIAIAKSRNWNVDNQFTHRSEAAHEGQAWPVRQLHHN